MVKLDILRDGKQMTASVEVADRNSILAQQQTSQIPGNEKSAPEEAGGVLGMSVRNLSAAEASLLVKSLHFPKPQGVLVTDVVPEGFAAELSVRAGDIILSINHQTVASVDDFAQAQKVLRPGQDVLLLVARQTGQTFTTMFLADTLH